MRNIVGSISKIDGTPASNVKIKFVLVDANGRAISSFDIGGERVIGQKTVTTDASGDFTVSLWENDKFIDVSYYYVTVSMSTDTPFKAALLTGTGDINWLDFKLSGQPVTPAELEVLQAYFDTVYYKKSDTRIARMTATQANNTTTLVNVTELVLSMEANSVYEVDCFVIFKSISPSIGLKLGYISPEDCFCNIELIIDNSSNLGQSVVGVLPVAASYNSGAAVGSSGSVYNLSAMIRGIVTTITAGDFAIQFASETLGSVTLQVGSILKMTKVV